MNERIKPLAAQARIKDHWSIDEGRYLTNYLNEQKFAELIVRECCRVMESLPPSTYHVGRSRMSEEIKQQFGLKE